MPSRWTDDRRTYRRWVEPYWEFPTTAPTEDSPRERSWSNDLLESGGNHGYAIRKGYMGMDHPDRGGNFLVHRRSYEEQILGGGGDVHFSRSTDPEGPASPYYLTNQWPYRDQFGNGHFPVPSPSSDGTLESLGTTAIARCQPAKPAADLATFVGELREGLPRAVGIHLNSKSGIRQARNAGDEYLNVEFGWKPLLRDIHKFADTYRNASRILDRYNRLAGVLIRRVYRFPTELSVEEESLGYRYPLPLLHPACYNGGPLELKLLKTEKVERWFSGSFVYPSVDSGNLFDKIDSANALYGVKPTPETLWNLAPWSWAADWVGNTGDVFANISSIQSGGLVMHHAYMMEHKTNTYEYSMLSDNTWRSHPGRHSIRQTFIGETKKRVGATPYGFGLNWDGFDHRQLAILASLGISRVK